MTRLKEAILKSQGFTSVKGRRLRGKVIVRTDLKSVYPSSAKTALMKLMEVVHQQAIEVLLFGDFNQAATARLLGLNKATICRWRQKLAKYWTEERLPDCYNCVWPCDRQTCGLMAVQDRWDLVTLKQPGK